MSVPLEPKPVKLIISILYSDRILCDQALDQLKIKFGEIDHIEFELPFHYTDYYQNEMGDKLRRCFFSFKNLFSREILIDVKIFTNKIENSLAKEDGRRKLNIDPGYLSDYQLILATGKNFSHRVYLGKGIFGDLTLIFKGEKFHSLPWTYPDYQDAPLNHMLMNIRKAYLDDKTKPNHTKS